MKKRCNWCNPNNKLYINYHDNEWGKKNLNDQYLFEMLLLETFQAGLSWECILNKRKNFEDAYDNFDIEKISNYNNKKINELLNNKNIIRNKQKIKSSINNAKIFKQIQKEYQTFHNYLKTFTNDETIYETGKDHNNLSNIISKDLKQKGMTFIGTKTIYSYLQAIGIIYSHDKNCFMHKTNNKK